MSSTKELAQQALIVAVLAGEAEKAVKARRTALDAELANADRVNVTDPDDPNTKLGMVYKTDTKPSSRVTDEAGFIEWHQLYHPHRIETHLEIEPSRMAEAIEIVHEFAPQLTRYTNKVAPWAREEVLKLTVKAREACGPEGELGEQAPPVEYIPPKPGTVTVKPSEDAPDVVRRLWSQNRIDLQSGGLLEIGGAE